MKRMVLAVFVTALAVLTLMGPRAASAGDDCALLSVSVTASFPNDPGFEGLWKYTVTGSWDVTQYGLSHIDFFLALKNLECICNPAIVKFGDPAGSSDGQGEVGPCTVFYDGQYLCMGDPSIPAEFAAPTIKFNAENDKCDAATTGTGTWVFYSPFPPAPPAVYPDAVAIKHGQQVCLGDLSGQMPQGDCSVPADAKSWGAIKSTYR